jgi:threonine dehydrogenase-like Zn-dependent dehydrogenase
MPLSGYLSLLRPEGKLVIVGAPEKGLPALQPFEFILNNINLGGSIIVSLEIPSYSPTLLNLPNPPHFRPLFLVAGIPLIDLRDA